MKCFKNISKILFAIFFACNVGAQEYQGYVEPSSDIKTYQPGDIFEGRLVLHPFKDLINEIKIEEKIFLNYFYILKMLEIGFSENNHEALEIKFRAVIREPFDASKTIQLNLSKNYKIEFRNFKVEGEVKVPQDYHVLEQKTFSRSFKWVAGLAVAATILFMLYFYKNRELFFARKNRKKQIKNFVEKIQNFRTREDFEKIYWDKYLWRELVDLERQTWKRLSKELNNIQFKKEWSSEELEKMRLFFSEFIEEVKNGI